MPKNSLMIQPGEEEAVVVAPGLVPEIAVEVLTEDALAKSTALPEDDLLLAMDDDDAVSVASEELEVNISEKMDLRPDPSELSPEQNLAWWRSFAPHNRADVCEELGGNESCLISAESLILRLGAGSEYKGAFTTSPRFLSLMFSLERFMASLNEVGIVNIDLIFFDDLKAMLMRQHPALWAFREAFRLHCVLHPGTFRFEQFRSWNDPDFANLLSTRHPFVFLMDDCSGLEPASSLIASPDEDEEPYKPAEHGYYPMYALALSITGRQMNVAFLYRLQRGGRRINASILGPESYHAGLEQQTRPLVDDLIAKATASIDANITGEWSLQAFQESKLPLRIALISAAAAEILEDVEADAWGALFFRVLLLHSLVVDRMNITQRWAALTPVESEMYTLSIEFFLAHIQKFLSGLLESPAEDVRKALEGSETQVADLVDEVVVREILYAIVSAGRTHGVRCFGADFFGLSGEDVELLNRAWASAVLDEAAVFFPIDVSDLLADDESVLNELPEELIRSDLLEPVEREPAVLPVDSNDYVCQMLGAKTDIIPNLMRRDTEGVDEGQALVAEFLESQREVLIDKDVWGAESSHFVRSSHFDVAANHVEVNGVKRGEKLPRYIERFQGDARERAIKKWQAKKMQESKVFARNINKYFGSLDKLHLPIVLVGGKAQSDHPWAATRDAAAAEEADVAVRKMEKKSAEKKKVSTKAALIIAKNNAALAEKKKTKQDGVAEHLYLQMAHVFKKKCTKPSVFNEALLELLIGARNASDSTVLEEFHAIDKVLTIPENQMEFLTALADKLMDPMEHTWKEKHVLELNQQPAILKSIGLIFRFVQVTVDKHLKRMSAQQIRVFQTLLLMLGFRRSAGATFASWAAAQWQLKNADKKEVDTVTVVPKKGGKPGAHRSATKTDKVVQDEAKDDKQRAAYIKKLEATALVKTCLRKFDFAVRPEIEATFQVQYLGPDMTRTLGSMQDPRVTFTPDGWQKRLLDVVDGQESCLVVAPTASGKTFACYYAMDQVLRYDNESCVVFISPTRALALQVESEVIARFSGKTYPTGCKTVLCGHLFEDRTENWNACQILITVPSAFDAVLSSTDASIREWQRRLKYAIMDEVHCIGEEKTGKESENLIQMLPCPFMALSATIANEGDFSGWLTRAQSFRGAKPVRFIKHDERYADLQTLYYSSPQSALYNVNPILCLDFARVKAGTLTEDFSLVPTDALQTFEHFQLALSQKVKAGELSEGDKRDAAFFIKDFHPEVYFVGSRAVTKKQYRRFLAALLVTIERFTQRGIISADDFERVVARIADSEPIGTGPLGPWWTSRMTTSSAGRALGDNEKSLGDMVVVKKEARQTVVSVKPHLGELIPTAGQALSAFNDPSYFLELIRDLEARKLMPALVFNFNRAFASRLFYRLVNKLVEEHHDKYYGTPEAAARTKAINKKRQDDYKADMARREMAEKWKTLSKQQREEQGIDEQLFAELTAPPPPPPADVAEEHDPDYFLCDRRIFMTNQEEFAGVMEFCRINYLVKSGRIPAILVEALRRGLGLYHDALHREYRRAVEFLFRTRYLRVVVSDVSLSLGVNMPCKTTVFAGDSPMLTPLLYRQTSGRAGRRGFDSLGNVVFWEFPFKKIRRLLCSKLAKLTGNFSVRPTTVLRTLRLSENLETEAVKEFHARMAAKGQSVEILDRKTLEAIDASRVKLRKLLSEPLFAVGASERVQEGLDINIKASFRFAIDLMRRLGVVSPNGQSDMLSSLVVALGGDEEPGNLFVPYLIMKGMFARQLTEPMPETDIVSLDPATLHIISFALRRREYSHSILRRIELASISPQLEKLLLPQRNVGDIFGLKSWAPLLPPLPDDIIELAKAFDRKIFESAIDRACAVSLSRPEISDSEYCLPMTSLPFKSLQAQIGASDFHDFVNSASIHESQRFYRSPISFGFVELETVEQMIATFRDIVYVEPALVPQLCARTAMVKMPGDTEPVEMPLVNSYVSNLLQFKSLRRVIEMNDIPAAEAYHVMLSLRESFGKMTAALRSETARAAVGSSEPADMSTILLHLLSRISARAMNVHASVKV